MRSSRITDPRRILGASAGSEASTPLIAPNPATHTPVFQRRQLHPRRRDAGRVDLGKHHALAFGQHAEHLAPRVDDHAVAEGAPATLMQAALRGGDHIALVLDGTRAQQQFPVRQAGGVGERGRRRQQVTGWLARRERQLAVQLGGNASRSRRSGRRERRSLETPSGHRPPGSRAKSRSIKLLSDRVRPRFSQGFRD